MRVPQGTPPPLLSVIVATKNATASFGYCLRSLAEQSCRDFEVIIQDGASTDDTLALAASFADALPSLRCNSRADRGIFHAWNRAIEHARGKWTLFLGADDRLAGPDVLEQSAPVLRRVLPDVLYVSGGLIFCDVDGGERDMVPGRSIGVPSALVRGMPVGHPALFHRTALFAKYRFDTGFRIAADYDFLCRTWKTDADAAKLDLVITRMAFGGVSTHPRNRLRVSLETAVVATKNFPGTWDANRLKGIARDAFFQAVYAAGGEAGLARAYAAAARLRRTLGGS